MWEYWKTILPKIPVDNNGDNILLRLDYQPLCMRGSGAPPRKGPEREVEIDPTFYWSHDGSATIPPSAL